MDVQAKVLSLKSLTELSRKQEGDTVTVKLKTVRERARLDHVSTGSHRCHRARYAQSRYPCFFRAFPRRLLCVLRPALRRSRRFPSSLQCSRDTWCGSHAPQGRDCAAAPSRQRSQPQPHAPTAQLSHLVSRAAQGDDALDFIDTLEFQASQVRNPAASLPPGRCALLSRGQPRARHRDSVPDSRLGPGLQSSAPSSGSPTCWARRRASRASSRRGAPRAAALPFPPPRSSSRREPGPPLPPPNAGRGPLRDALQAAPDGLVHRVPPLPRKRDRASGRRGARGEGRRRRRPPPLRLRLSARSARD